MTQSPAEQVAVPPHDLNAEATVLAACLLSPEALDAALEILEPNYFYSEANGLIFEATKTLRLRGTPIDILSITSFLRDNGSLPRMDGSRYLTELADLGCPTDVREKSRVVYEKWRLRTLLALCQQVLSKGYGYTGNVQSLIDNHERDVVQLRCLDASQHVRHQPINQALRSAFQQITGAAELGKSVGSSTGYEKVDSKTGGLHRGELVVIASRPGMGKSAFVLNLGVNVASPRMVATPPKLGEQKPGDEQVEPGHGVCVFSLEMPHEQLAVRMVCAEGRVDINRVRRTCLQADDWRRLTEAASYMASLPIWVDRTYTVAEMRASVLRIKSEFDRAATATTPERKLGLVIVDHIQLLEAEPRRQNREEETADAARALKRMAMDLDVTVIAVSELSRAVETRTTKDKRPQLSDLRDSGAIEDSADAVIFVYRDEYYNPETTNMKGIAELIVAKQRSGPTGKVLVRFIASCARFDNLTPDDCRGLDDD